MLTAFQIPHLNSIVVPATGQSTAIGGLPQAHAAIIATTGQPRAIRTPRHPADSSWLRMAHPQAGAGSYLPHVHPLLIARTGQPRAIRTPRHPIEEGVDVVMVLQD